MSECQIANPYGRWPRCPEQESGGIRCEKPRGHRGRCWVSRHTIEHYLAGNGYACAAIGPQWLPKIRRRAS